MAAGERRRGLVANRAGSRASWTTCSGARKLVFTFGPYGFLENLLPFSRLTAGLALLYALAITWGLAALIVSALRQQWGLLPAGVVAWAALGIAANLLEAPELALATALGLALASFRAVTTTGRLYLAGRPRRAGRLSAPGRDQRRPRHHGPVGTGRSRGSAQQAGHGRAGQRGPFVAVPAVALTSAGQSLGNVASYVRGSLSVALGYGPAMSLSTGRNAENWYAVVDVALLVGLFVLALTRPAVARKGCHFPDAARMDLGGVERGFRPPRHPRSDLLRPWSCWHCAWPACPVRCVLVQAGAIALAALLACLANGHPPPSLRSPAEDTKALATEVRDLVVPGALAQGAAHRPD